MRQHHNVLYITTEGASIHKRDVAVEVQREGQPNVKIPRHHLESIVCMGYNIHVSPYLAAACAEEGISVVYLSPTGRFVARLVGAQTGNVLLRRAQMRQSEGAEAAKYARAFVVGKVANFRTMLRRAARETDDAAAHDGLSEAAEILTVRLEDLRQDCASVDHIRGLEGAATQVWFSCFPHLLRGDACFAWAGRNRRPPLDPVNAVLSFLYALLCTDCISAAESVGLDPQVAFLHVDRPGRPALALDLMEELRPILADRTLFALVNRRQLGPSNFDRQASGAVLLTEEGRKTLLTLYQERKREEIRHDFLDQQTTWSIIPLLQARLLARTLRGDLDGYPPFLLR